MPNLPPQILYIDLNSCFATIEQQARPCLRGKPLAITNRLVPNSCIITASYEAKAMGVKVGMRRLEAESLCPNLIFTESEPSKYIYVHQLLKNIMLDYSPAVTMKSIDEGIIDLKQAPPHIKARPVAEIATELKSRLKTEIGCYMRCNVGVSSNRFLAKLAAGLHKPDGFDLITPANLRQILTPLSLTDLPGINTHLERRLRAYHINTPLDFLDAPEIVLRKQVFRSIDGTKWYKRLRGIEVDDQLSTIKSIGRQYVLESRFLTPEEVWCRLAHLCEDVGYRLRSQNLYARGVYVWGHNDTSHKVHSLGQLPFSSDQAILKIAKSLFTKLPSRLRIIGITLYKLTDTPNPQISLFEEALQRSEKVSTAIDAINCHFGARTIHTALTLNTNSVQAKLPFGSTRYLDRSIK